jgi:hypothetical protein
VIGRWVILVDGRALEECSVDPSLPASDRMARHLASLRRFEAGRELVA